jgi:ATP-grasp domain, R2K clade family 3
MEFIIQKDCQFSGGETDRLVQALKDNKVKYTLADRPYIQDGVTANADIFVRGSIEFVTEFNNMYGEYTNLYTTTLSNYTYSEYTKDIDDDMLNQSYIIMPWHKLYRPYTRDIIKSATVSNRFFIRPNSGRKIFTGTTLGYKYFTKELDIIKSLPSSNINDNDLVVISSEKQIDAEYRLLMHKNTIIDYAPYIINNPVNVNIKDDLCELASKIKYFPDTFYVLDICYNKSFPYILELNGASTSGWYDMDYNKIVKYIKEVNNEQD